MIALMLQQWGLCLIWLGLYSLYHFPADLLPVVTAFRRPVLLFCPSFCSSLLNVGFRCVSVLICLIHQRIISFQAFCNYYYINVCPSTFIFFILYIFFYSSSTSSLSVFFFSSWSSISCCSEYMIWCLLVALVSKIGQWCIFHKHIEWFSSILST